jgi:hypothetical protein
MSTEALAKAYTQMLNDDGYKDSVAQDAGALSQWDLTDEERQVLVDEAGNEVEAFAIGHGPVMSFMAKGMGPPLPGSVASALGGALNGAAGLPLGSLTGPGFLANAACCPWGHGVTPSTTGMLD